MEVKTSHRCGVLTGEASQSHSSLLYGAAWRAAKALGYKRLITYTLASEAGVSLRAAGWKNIGVSQGRSWNTPSRPRIDKHPIGQKTTWEAV